MSVVLSAGTSGLPKLSLSHPSGSRAELYLHGAHLTSWVPSGGVDALFLSHAAEIASGKAIRGGVPIIFPQFAKRGPLPKHGFARVLEWRWIEPPTSGDAARATLELVDSERTRATWPHRFRARMTVELEERTLSQRLRIENAGADLFSFTAALHTYLSVGDLNDTAIEGLGNAAFEDHSSSGGDVRGDAAALLVSGEIDRIYMEAPRLLRVRDRANARTLELGFDGFEDVVVWNPGDHGAAALPDMQRDEYLRMICLETAQVGRPVELAAGDAWEGGQRMEVLADG